MSVFPVMTRQHALVTLAVVLVHVLLLIGVLNHITQPEPEPTLTEMQVQWISPAPEVAQPAPTPMVSKAAPKQKANKTIAPAAVVAPSPSPVLPAAETSAPVSTALASSNNDSKATNTPQSANATSNPTGVAAPPRIELPSSVADYLNNPRPPYPPLSKRLGEQGKVVVRVLIETDGTASQAEIRTSSGYDRLDQTALKTVKNWRYVPGKRNGVPEAMWFNVPINFVLE